MTSKKHIVIVGGGCSAVFLLAQLAKRENRSFRVTVCERSGSFARGIAYGTSRTEHLLNVPARNMSAFSDTPGHFLEWLQEQGMPYAASDFAPRKIYGDYLQSVFESSLQSLEGQVTLLTAEVTGISGKSITTSAGVLVTDALVFATGNAVPQRPQVAPGTNFHLSPYGVDYESLDPDKPIAILGTGLSMVDAVLSLHASGFKGRIMAFSRHGLLPLAHCVHEGYPAFLTPGNMPNSASGIMTIVRHEVKKARAQGIAWQAVIDSLRPYSNDIWQELLAFERKKLQRMMPFWNIHRHRTAPEVGKIIGALRESGQLSIIKGRVKAVSIKDGGVVVQTDKDDYLARCVINCMGYAARPAPQGEGIYAIGPVLTDRYFETTAVPEIRVQAKALAEKIISDMD